MYTEEYEKRGYPIGSFLIKLVLVVIFVLLLVWLLPKFIVPKLNVGTNNNTSCKGSSTCEVKGLDALTSQIFANNLEKMKDAAITYYTAERLPKTVGESDQMTLSDMIGKKLVTPLIDKNNKAVDVEKSYVKITKMNDEYLLKVNIKDSEKEDYILVHLGCYAYCDTYLCQKETTKTTVGTKSATVNPIVPITPVTPTPSVNPDPTPKVIPECMKVGNKYYDKNGNVVSEVNYIISCKAPKCETIDGYYFGKDGTSVTKSRFEKECKTPVPTPTYKCEYKNGKYYDKNGNIVTEVNYIISCQSPKCQVINGYYFGKDGKNVNKATYEKECTTKKTYKCEYKNGKYYDKNGNVVSEVNYIISCQAPVCKLVNGYYFGKDGRNVSRSTFEKECTTKETYKCENIKGQFYDKNGNIVSEVDYIISCQAPKCKIVNGYYVGKDGRNVNKSTYKKECTTPVYKCEYKNGKYYDKNGKVVNEVDYIISCQAPKCKVVNGYYFGKNGDSVSKTTYEHQCFLYEYKKTTSAQFSEWTKWSDWSKTDCSTQEVNCSDSDINCLYKLQRYTRKEKIGTYQKTYAKKRQDIVQTGSYQVQSCENYNYVEINKKLYATTTTTTYTTINTITTTTQRTTGTWSYNGRASYSNPPADSASTHYKFVGADYSYCSETCSTLPNYYYDSYTYTGGLANVSSTTSSKTTAGTPLSETHLAGQTTTYAASCGKVVTKTIPIYSTVTATEKATRTEPLYGDVCYKSTKTRTLISSGSTQYKWSNYNDTTLLNNNWKYTGNTKKK